MESSTLESELLTGILRILGGINLAETESENGWWETSTGAEFGNDKLLELIKFMSETVRSKASPKMLQELIDKLRAEFPGHHLEIQIFPSGGEINANACEECGTTVSASALWRYRTSRVQTLDDAVMDLKTRLGLFGGSYGGKTADQIYCGWKQFDLGGDDDSWDTACGNKFLLIEGSPKENDYNFCPGCGRHVKEKEK